MLAHMPRGSIAVLVLTKALRRRHRALADVVRELFRAHGAIERSLVGLRGLGGPAHLPHVLQRGRGDHQDVEDLVVAEHGGLRVRAAQRVVLGDGIPTITVDGETNPHFWLDPTLVERHYLPAIRDALVRLRPDATDDITTAADAYARRLQTLDADNTTTLAAIPAEHRKLVTFHDAFPYFAQHYGFELVGVILENPGQEPSAAELATLVREVKAAGVPAVFSEAQFDPKLARTLADEAGITKVVTTLYNDTLGPAPADTYIGLMTWDVDEIVKALR